MRAHRVVIDAPVRYFCSVEVQLMMTFSGVAVAEIWPGTRGEAK